MITIQKLYEETNSGLDIILHYYPQAEVAVGSPKTKFKVRQQEATASAVLLPPDKTHDFYRVCDFGDEGHGISPIDIAMKEECMTKARFYELILMLAARHNVTDELNRSVNKPNYEKRKSLPDEKEGVRPFKLLKRIPEAHLKIFGPRVTQENADTLNWHEAEWIGYVQNGETSIMYSTENYPIFMRECVTEEGQTFYKIYEPLNPDKGFRFKYTPDGVKPKQFTNGWRELLHEIDLQNAMRDPDDPQDREIVKVKEAFICSGERDAICCLSQGGIPLWFNSETYTLQPSEYEMIMSRVETLYNIPDIDETGIRRGNLLAMTYMDIKTIWLPDMLKKYKDNRGKYRKDLRDWMELRPSKADFNNLKSSALQARFWDYVSNNKTGKQEIVISTIRLYNFIQVHGFCALRDDDSDTTRYIHVDGHIVTSVRNRDIRKFVREWAEQNFLPENIRNAIANSARFNENYLENLKEVDLNFTNYTPTSQTLFFKNTIIVVSKDGIREYKKNEYSMSCYVWSENVIQHSVHLLKEPWRITKTDDSTYPYDIEILDSKSSPFMGYLINSSRLFWRKEMESRFLICGETEEALQKMNDYKFFHRFCIDGEGLTDIEIKDQKKCLINKIFVIGYLLHHYKTPSRPWAPIAMDSKIGEQGECNGRSGKSFLFRTLAMFCNTVTLSGRNPKLMENPHVFEQVSKHTDFILVDDCAQYLQMNLFYDLISSDMTVNPKNNRIFSIPFSLSPKFAFSTNYVPSDFDSSSMARSLYVVFSDYYHEKTSQNDYRESRRIADDFGFDLYSESYTEEQWNADINILIQCEAFYLSLIETGAKLQPPMENIMYRKKLQDMGDNFQEWAESYFAEDGDNLNRFIVRKNAFENFRYFANTQNIKMNTFSKKIKVFCELMPYIKCLNPVPFQNSQGRIIRTVNGIKEEMIYIETFSHEESEIEDKDDSQTNFLDKMDDEEDPDG